MLKIESCKGHLITDKSAKWFDDMNKSVYVFGINRCNFIEKSWKIFGTEKSEWKKYQVFCVTRNKIEIWGALRFDVIDEINGSKMKSTFGNDYSFHELIWLTKCWSNSSKLEKLCWHVWKIERNMYNVRCLYAWRIYFYRMDFVVGFSFVIGVF